MSARILRRRPSDRRRAARRRSALLGFGAAQTAIFVPLAVVDRRMQATGGPGIIPFEFAGTPEAAQAILDRWGPQGRVAARTSLLLDFPFLVAYTGFNLALTEGAGDALRRAGLRRAAAASRAVEALQVVAGACDAVENTALLGVVAGRTERLPAVAKAFASTKFALLGVGWAYILAGLAARAR